MKITIGSVFPEIYDSFFKKGIISKSIEKNLLKIDFIDFLKNSNGNRIDAPVVGHNTGMLIKPEIIEKAVDATTEKYGEKPFTIFFSPHGKKLNQNLLKKIFDKVSKKNLLNEFVEFKPILLLSGRYEGFDHRTEEEYADEIISIGDFVLMGGDLPVMVFLESFARLIPNIIGKKESVENDSFSNHLVDCPHFCNPDEWKSKKIPEILKSGNHKEIYKWQENESLKRTFSDHFDWWRKNVKNKDDKLKIKNYIPNHYAVLLHNDVMMPDGRVSESSVTSIDIHDIARSSKTYGIKNYFVVTRIKAQQDLVKKFLNFWQDGYGTEMNKNRSEAIENVNCFEELDDVIKHIKEIEKKDPLCIVTSSRREIPHERMINYFDQKKVWAFNRPIIFIFGTAHGISPELMNKIDFRLIPIEGIEDFNFLSVRSAAAIVFDRWLGINSKDF